ncbi:MAG: hypothetical protein AAGI34_09425 [Pseudomonadota bacterium]
MTNLTFADLAAFEPRESTEAEKVERALAAIKPVWPFLTDRLPPDVLALMPPAKWVDLPPFCEFKGLWDDQASAALVDALRPLFDGQPKFFKLSSRSPKESHDEHTGVQTWCAEQAAYRMSVSERCLDDCVLFLPHPNYRLKAVALDWRPYLPEWEVRCFVKDGRFIAATQYDPRPSGYWQRQDRRQKVRDTVEGLWRDQLHPRMHVDTYVFDVCLMWPGSGLIELNPYGLSDPCVLESYEAVEAFGGDVAFHPMDQPG